MSNDSKMISRIETVKTQELIRVEHVFGNGTGKSPIRKEVEFWTKDGILIGKRDINDLKEYDHVNH